ncbi:hypothetical protein [Streptomyces shenzhenensis]|uniref:hypothetical protein n=1 Tax=Streptomyces shenzhenensis TaxID=943815 RepID=UPI0015F0327E|nr:hypothetical protein [Streptomyces shenzhenensis]
MSHDETTAEAVTRKERFGALPERIRLEDMVGTRQATPHDPDRDVPVGRRTRRERHRAAGSGVRCGSHRVPEGAGESVRRKRFDGDVTTGGARGRRRTARRQRLRRADRGPAASDRAL